MSNLRIDIASQFDDKGFNKAQKATGALDKSVEKLGKTLAGVFSAYKVAQYAKNAMSAYAKQQQAIALLGNQLKNLGLESATGASNQFIESFSKQTGIIKGELYPAYEQLVRVTGSVSKTQNLMSLAFNVSKGTGNDFATTIDALSQAYVGNYKGLKQLNTGLTKAELQTKTFSEIQGILAQEFGGAGAAALNTYQGQLDLLKVTTDNAAESIGKTLFDALANISGQGGFKSFISTIETVVNIVDDLITGISRLIRVVEILAEPKQIGQKFKDLKAAQTKWKFEDIVVMQQRAGMKEWVPTGAVTPEEKAAELAAQKRAKALADAIKKQTTAQAELNKKKKETAALDELSLRYKQAEAIFNLDQIELAAASMSKQTAEDYARIKLKQDLITLQNAIQNNDLAAAEAAAKIVDQDYARVQAYQAINIAAGIQAGLITNIKTAASLIPSNLSVINLDNLQSAIVLINQLIASLNNIPAVQAGGATGGGTAGTSFNPNIPFIAPPGAESQHFLAPTSVGSAMATTIDRAALNNQLSAARYTGQALAYASMAGLPLDPSSYNATMNPKAPVVNITISENAKGIVDVVMDTTQDQSASGIPTQITRNARNLAW